MRVVASGAVLLLALGVLTPAARAKEEKEGPAPRYPASFRLAVAEAIERGLFHLREQQAPEGHWGPPDDPHGVGHTALPLLALLKAGVPADDEAVVRARASIRRREVTSVYSAGCWLMALHALYAPHLDTQDTDVGSDREARVRAEAIREALTPEDRRAIETTRDFLLEAQNARGLWHYGLPEAAASRSFDLSNTQYALLGLRAVADCGLEVPGSAWRAALQGLIGIQDPEGEAVRLDLRETRDGYVFVGSERAAARPFRYKDGRAHGPKGENTVPTEVASGSMTTAGVACVAICMEGLWRSRRFSGKERREANHAIRDGLAWMQVNFCVTENPGRGADHHGYYLYGLERMGMLVGRRWIGSHDWYREGAEVWLATQGAVAGGWGGHEQDAFAILFLKRATARAVVVTR